MMSALLAGLATLVVAAIAEHADADELMVVHQASSVASRLRSLDVLADAMGLTAVRS